MKKRIFAAALAMVTVVSMMTACASTKENDTSDKSSDTAKEETLPESTKVVLNEVAHSIFYAPMYVAIEEGYFDEEGIDLELVTGFGVT